MTNKVVTRQLNERANVRALLLLKAEAIFNELEKVITETDNDVVRLKAIEIFAEYALGKAPQEIATTNLNLNATVTSEEQRKAALRNFLVQSSQENVIEHAEIRPGKSRELVERK